MIFVRLIDENGSEYYINPNNIDCMYTTTSGKTHLSTTGGMVIILNDEIQTVLNRLPRQLK